MSISSLSASPVIAALSAAGGAAGARSCTVEASPAAATAAASATARPGSTDNMVSVSIPGSPFMLQERTSPGSLVVTPQIPPLLFDSQAETLLSSAVGSLIDTTA